MIFFNSNCYYVLTKIINFVIICFIIILILLKIMLKKMKNLMIKIYIYFNNFYLKVF